MGYADRRRCEKLASGQRKRRPGRPRTRPESATGSRREVADKRSVNIDLPAVDRIAARVKWSALTGQAVGGSAILGEHVAQLARAQAAGDVLAVEDTLLACAATCCHWLDQLADHRRLIAAYGTWRAGRARGAGGFVGSRVDLTRDHRAADRVRTRRLRLRYSRRPSYSQWQRRPRAPGAAHRRHTPRRPRTLRPMAMSINPSAVQIPSDAAGFVLATARGRPVGTIKRCTCR